MKSGPWGRPGCGYLEILHAWTAMPLVGWASLGLWMKAHWRHITGNAFTFLPLFGLAIFIMPSSWLWKRYAEALTAHSCHLPVGVMDSDLNLALPGCLDSLAANEGLQAGPSVSDCGFWGCGQDMAWTVPWASVSALLPLLDPVQLEVTSYLGHPS
jgi:hypothetical protein